jgi:hypothetical protein
MSTSPYPAAVVPFPQYLPYLCESAVICVKNAVPFSARSSLSVVKKRSFAKRIETGLKSRAPLQ